LATGTDHYDAHEAEVGTLAPSALDLLSQSESRAIPDGSRPNDAPDGPFSRDPTGSAQRPARGPEPDDDSDIPPPDTA
ncbi:MAG TPA: hypothetical protein VMZ50_08915, partial [Phycisphaerae bacterium]|nr:hypothetical protein [Phycisphaerae bacterium]